MSKMVLSDDLIQNLPLPPKGSTIVWDAHERAPRGFGICLTAKGVRSFILAYRSRAGDNASKERRMIIGRAGINELSISAARRIAQNHRIKIQDGHDPLAQRRAAQDAENERRAAADVNELSDRYLRDWAEKRKRPRSVAEDRAMLKQHVRRKLGGKKVRDITRSDLVALHSEITHDYETPARANLVMSLLSKMMNLAIDWSMRSDNPVRGIERNHVPHRERYIDAKGELARLLSALDSFSDREGVNAIRLLLLTGARRSEVLTATWDQFDLEAGVWTKPSSHTKQKRAHRLELSPQARQLLQQMRRAAANGQQRATAIEQEAENEKDYRRRARLLNQARLARAQNQSTLVFPSARKEGKPLEGLRALWADICKEARLTDVRLHDLRHTFASLLLRRGHSLKVIGHMLGHSQSATTDRYAHVMADVARAAASDVGRQVATAGKGRSAQVIKIGGQRR